MPDNKQAFIDTLSLLYVEDENDISQDMCDMLAYSFKHITHMSNGKEGLNEFTQGKYDIVLTDIQMPEMNGLEMIESIRKISKDVPILIMSAFNDADYLKKSLDLGVSGYILKPINYEKVENAFEKIIDILYDKFKLEKSYTALEKAKAEAIQANKIKSTFLANMSHEIRTPLNASMGFIDIIQEDFDDETLLYYVDIIKNNNESLLSIVNDILDSDKIDSEQLAINIEAMDIRKTVEQVVHLFSAKANENNLRIDINIANDMLKTSDSDPLRVRQILSNLLSNAVKFSKDSTNIVLSVYMRGTDIVFSVKDNGIGISKEYQKEIFTPFTQADSTTTKEFGGTGLGLCISKKLAQLLGGNIELKSELGKGSEFIFFIKSKNINRGMKETKELTKKSKQDNVNFDGSHVLLVEDTEANQVYMGILFKKLNLTYDLAKNGEEAIEMFKKFKYDVIIMDENMPIMCGIEATKHILVIEKKEKLKHTPIIALTGNALNGDKQRFLKAGMDEYLTKPLNKKQLVATLEVFLETVDSRA
ncbi:response regulator [Sulfurimonas sp. SAG-AH-194-C21]|nr:response regulator [Sulfurimonas sp. SAG-AH-194-C21]MDF1882344.1 response regulator [Sulfurimonas sp. SAG-AH-194-C21]